MQALAKTLYTVSAEFDVGIIGQENKKTQRAHVESLLSQSALAVRQH